MVVGHWTFVGGPQNFYECRSGWLPAKGAEFPEFLRVSRLLQYSTRQITGAGYKELVHRQLYQEASCGAKFPWLNLEGESDPCHRELFM